MRPSVTNSPTVAQVDKAEVFAASFDAVP
jgi:hypothetical protein